MSAVAGILHLDGQPVDERVLSRMTGAMAHRGPDGAGHWAEGPVGLAHGMLRTTPESLQEKQPLTSEDGDLCLVLDGRVDNRDELAAVLRSSGSRFRTDTDAELVLRAFERWGEDCPARIVGDFALAVWDGRRRRLFCARDPLGIRPLYYQADGRTFRWASELHALFQDRAVPREWNEGMVGEYLSTRITHREETLHRGILRLPPAHSLLVDARGVHIRRYWDPDPARQIRCRDDREYAEAFRDVFREAVRCRLRSAGPVGVELSGGLDSSSVTVTAHELLEAGLAPAAGLRAFSLVFPGLECDERSYIDEVVEGRDMPSTLVAPATPPLGFYEEQARRCRDLPEYPTCVMADSLRSAARARGIGVMLTGYGGDDWLGGSAYHYADLLGRGRLLAFVRQVVLDRRIRMIDRPLFSALHYGIWPLLPPAARRLAKGLWTQSRPAPWVDAHFAARIGLAERLRREPVGVAAPTFAQGDLRRALNGGWHAHGVDMLDRTGGRWGLEYRHPFHDRRLVEFALALPEEQRRRRDLTKFVLRGAMAERLPARVAARRDKADFGAVFAEALQSPGVEAIFGSLGTAACGWVDAGRCGAMYRDMVARRSLGDPRYTENLWRLWMVLGMELLCRSESGG